VASGTSRCFWRDCGFVAEGVGQRARRELSPDLHFSIRGGKREREREREREESKSKSMPDHTIGRLKSGESLGVVLSSSFSLSNRAKHRKSESLFFLSEAPVYQTERGYALFTALCFASAAASGAGE